MLPYMKESIHSIVDDGNNIYTNQRNYTAIILGVIRHNWLVKIRLYAY